MVDRMFDLNRDKATSASLICLCQLNRDSAHKFYRYQENESAKIPTVIWSKTVLLSQVFYSQTPFKTIVDMQRFRQKNCRFLLLGVPPRC